MHAFTSISLADDKRKPSTLNFDQTFLNQLSTKFPFIKPIQIIQVSSNGEQYCDDSLSLRIDIPEGAVPKGSLLHLAVGMCLYGPFKFPDGLHPITPILMLCPQSNIELSKSYRVTLPHIIEDAEDGDVEALGIEVIKADHMKSLVAGESIFDTIIKDSHLSFSTLNNIEQATFSLSHFCFITLRGKKKSEVQGRTRYCVCPLLPPPRTGSSHVFTYHLCVTYFMSPCLKVSVKSY